MSFAGTSRTSRQPGDAALACSGSGDPLMINTDVARLTAAAYLRRLDTSDNGQSVDYAFPPRDTVTVLKVSSSTLTDLR
jgi:hypothetical protein